MNGLGATLAWSALLVTALLIPATFLHILASRRGPASGAWVAALSLGLTLCVGVISVLPRSAAVIERSTVARIAGVSVAARETVGPATLHDDRGSPRSGFRHFLRFARAGTDLGRSAVEPPAALRRWGGVLSAAVLAGIAVGLARLALGLWAVGLCRYRGTPVNDPDLMTLCDEIGAAMGIRRGVPIREVAGLTTPATAGWRRPLVLLPDDWRGWSEGDRRAVLAHELAHIERSDYVVGLLARLTLAVHFYHPLVRWMAARLALQQELAADAAGVRFASGREAYLRTLSRLALKQDGPSPRGLARAFLASRGTLIRRIAMLQNSSPAADRPWSRRRRLAAGFSLLAVTLGLAALPRPARALAGDEDAPPKIADTAPLPLKAGPTPFDFRFASEAAPGIVAFRPAAALRRVGESYLSEEYKTVLTEIAGAFKVDTKAPGFRTLGLEDIDWVMGGLGFGKSKAPDDGRTMHSLMFGHVAVRATSPFDWLAWLRQYRMEFQEARDGGRVYYRVTGPVQPYLGQAPCVYLPDDRTIVFDEEPGIRSLLGREATPVPAPFKGMDWERVGRSLFLVAIDNQGGRFAKSYDAGRADDAVVLSLFKNVDTWALSVADSDALDLNALGVCPGAEGRTTAAVIESLTSLARRTLDAGNPAAKPGEDTERAARLAKDLLTDLRVSPTDHSVEVRYDGKVTLKKLSGLMDAAAKEANAPR